MLGFIKRFLRRKVNAEKRDIVRNMHLKQEKQKQAYLEKINKEKEELIRYYVEKSGGYDWSEEAFYNLISILLQGLQSGKYTTELVRKVLQQQFCFDMKDLASFRNAYADTVIGSLQNQLLQGKVYDDSALSLGQLIDTETKKQNVWENLLEMVDPELRKKRSEELQQLQQQFQKETGVTAIPAEEIPSQQEIDFVELIELEKEKEKKLADTVVTSGDIEKVLEKEKKHVVYVKSEPEEKEEKVKRRQARGPKKKIEKEKQEKKAVKHVDKEVKEAPALQKKAAPKKKTYKERGKEREEALKKLEEEKKRTSTIETEG
ncbi:hypothetical protein ACFL56_00700 [Candidatus Margulisiibacteriota bacterium]